MGSEFLNTWRAQPLRTAAWALLGAVVLAAAGLLWGETHARAFVLHLVAARTGREARIEGPFALQLFTRDPVLKAQQVAIGNPPLMSPGVTARAQAVTLHLRWQLSLTPLRLERIEAQGVELTLLRDAQGRANWYLSPNAPGSGPPLIHGLDIPEAHVTLRDERRHLDFSGVVSALDHGDPGEPEGLHIRGAGRLNGRAASFTLEGDPLASVRRDAPYHFVFRETSGEARLTARLELPQPFDMRSLHGPFEASGPSFADLYFLVGLRLPPSGPFTLSGGFEREQMRFVYRDMAAHFGRSDLEGTLQVEGSTGRAHVTGGVSSHQLVLADIGWGSFAAPASQAPAAGINVAALRGSDWNVTFTAAVLQAGTRVLKAAGGSLSIEQGVLRIEQARAGLAGGELAAEARLDVTPNLPQATLEVRLRELELSELFASANPGFSGQLSGRLKLSGEGHSFHELLSTASGTAAALLPGGTLRQSTAELTSLDFNGALRALLKSREQTPIRCGVASFEVQDGVAAARSLLLDTQNVLISGSGVVNLDSAALDLTLQGHPKHPRLGLREAVSIQGTLRQPQVRLSGKGALVQAGAAIGLGIALTPLAALLAFINPGLAHNADCAQLLEQAGAPAGVPAANLAQAPRTP